MYPYLRIILPLYLVLYLVFLMLIRMVTIGRKIGKNPIVLSSADDAHGLISTYFKLWMALLGIYAAVYAIYPDGYRYFMPVYALESVSLRIAGLVLLGISLIWTYIAQAHMRTSWRVGIDEQVQTELITGGIFRYSRNPIYLGMMVAMIGFFLTTPNAFTLLMGTVGVVLIQIQVRLEEAFLEKVHGDSYLQYKNAVRRFL